MQVIEKRAHNKTSLVLQNLVDTGGHDAVGCWKSHLQLTICPRHRKFFVITWRSNKGNCAAPISVKGERYYTLTLETAIPVQWCISSYGVAQVYKNN